MRRSLSLLQALGQVKRYVADAGQAIRCSRFCFSRLTAQVKRYVAVASATTRPAEAFSLDALEDERVVRRRPELHAALNDELRYLESVEGDVWECLAAAIGETLHHNVRHSALHAAHTSHAFVTHRVFSELDRQPWNFATMDPGQALAQISAMSESDITHQVAHQISTLMKLGRPRRLLMDALLLLREVSWTTKAAEQSHASITAIHRYHPEASADQVALRAGLHACRHLFHDTDVAKREQALGHKVATIKRKVGHTISGRNVFCAEFIKGVTQSRLSNQSQDVRRQVFAKHHHHYDLLPLHRKRDYDELALEATRVHRCSVEGDLAHAHAALQLFRRRLDEEKALTGTPNMLGECRFDDRSLQQVAERLSSGTLGRDGWCERWFKGPALNDDHKASLDQFQPISETRALVPAWAALVCTHRDIFRDCAFASARPEATGKVWLLTYATQKPRLAMFLELSRAHHVQRCPSCVPLDAADVTFVHDFRYEIDCKTFASAEALPVMEDGSDILVIPDIAMIGHCRAVSDAEACAWNEFRPLVQLVSGREPTARPKKPAPPPTMLEAHPWIRDLLRNARGNVSKEGADKGDVAEDLDGMPLAGASDTDVDAAWQELNAVHQALVEAPGLGASEDFTCFVRTDNRERVRNTEARQVSVSARGGEPKAWCQRFSLRVMYSYSVHKFGEEAAWNLALETARRLQHFYCIYVASNDVANFRYSDEDLAAAPECEEFCIWARSLDADSVVWSRIADYTDALLPRNPVA